MNPAEAPILAATRLTCRFGGLSAINAVDVSIHRGELLGLIGPNGAGKTTLFNLFMGLIAPSDGEIVLEGVRINGLKPHQICRRGMVKTFQNVALFPGMTVLDNVLTGGLLHLGVHDAKVLAMDTLAKEGMAPIAGKRASELTFPERSLVELARALCTQPKIVLLDEVMAALSHVEMDQVLALIRKLRHDEGLTFVVIEHHMRAIMTLCERIVVLNFGEKIAEGSPSAISNHPEVIAAYLGQELQSGAAA